MCTRASEILRFCETFCSDLESKNLRSTQIGESSRSRSEHPKSQHRRSSDSDLRFYVGDSNRPHLLTYPRHSPDPLLLLPVTHKDEYQELSHNPLGRTLR